jgi:hypothetical protein
MNKTIAIASALVAAALTGRFSTHPLAAYATNGEMNQRHNGMQAV